MKMFKILSVFALITAFNLSLLAQCESWAGKVNEDDLVSLHSVYREFVKSENYAAAYEPWSKLYEEAPTADGRRDYHFIDGIAILMDKFNKSADDKEREQLSERILSIYDAGISCYDNRAIQRKVSSDEAYMGYISELYSQKAYDMYYYLRAPYSETLDALKNAMITGGDRTVYTVIAPYADIAVYEFTNNNIDKAEARRIHDDLLALAMSNESNGSEYAAYYTQAKEAMLGKFREIEDYIFDCDYFKNENIEEYNEKKDDPYFCRELYTDLRRRGCSDDDPFLADLKTTYEKFAAEINAQRQAEFEASNPALVASRAYKENDFNLAISKYREAIAQESDNEKKANYHYSIASILFRKQNKNTEARSEARMASQLRPGWGRPHALIGDIYAKNARGCGDSWNQRKAILAAYDKWSAAKGLEDDPTFVAELNNKMSSYRKSFPTKDEGFMRGLKEGSTDTVDCWIGETVTLRYN